MRSFNTAWSLFALGLFLFALIGFAGVSWTVNNGGTPAHAPAAKLTKPKTSGLIAGQR